MTITIGQIVLFATGVSAIIALCLTCYKLFKTFTKNILAPEVTKIDIAIASLKGWNNRQQHDIDNNLKLNAILLQGIRACLEGLVEQGCNGPVKQGIKDIDAYLLQHIKEGASSREE